MEIVWGNMVEQFHKVKAYCTLSVPVWFFTEQYFILSVRITLTSSHSCTGTLPKVISEVAHILSLFDLKDMQRNQLCLTLLYDMLLHEYNLRFWRCPASKSMLCFARVKTKKEASNTARQGVFKSIFFHKCIQRYLLTADSISEMKSFESCLSTLE